MTTEGAAFLRARRPEQKRQRYAAILDAARTLALRDGVGAVSLAGIAASVGMHKSALLKYFGTREEIFLRVAETEWQEWAQAVVTDLDPGPAPADDPTEHVVTTLGRSLDDRPLLCQLLIHTPLTLERNVSFDAVRSFKTTTMRTVDAVAEAVHRALPALSRSDCHELLTVAGLAAAGLWQVTHPPPVVVRLYTEPPVPAGIHRYSTLDFGSAVTRFARVYIAGLQQVGPRPDASDSGTTT